MVTNHSSVFIPITQTNYNMSHQPTADIVLIQQIAARANVNKEIIARIKSAHMESSIRYYISSPIESYDEGYITIPKANARALGIRLTPRNHTSYNLLEGIELSIREVEDFFNDKLDYSAQKFADLERLNEAMINIARKYELFGPTPKAIEVLQSFKENYDTLHIALGKVEEDCITRQKRRDAVLESVDELKTNKRVEEIIAQTAKLSASFHENNY